MADLVAGRNAVLEALKSGRAVNKLFVLQGPRDGSLREIIGLAAEKGVPFSEVDRNFLERLTDERHQGVVAETAPFAYVEIEDILRLAREKGEDPLILLLADLEDPHNFGAILRTAETVGVHGVVIPKRRSVQVNTTVAKVSAGAAEYVPVARVSNLVQAVEELKAAGLWVTGADMHGEKNLWQTDLKGPLALIIGGEGYGIPRLLREKCDFLTAIPMLGKISSLNASVAASVMMYEILRQRQNKQNA